MEDKERVERLVDETARRLEVALDEIRRSGVPADAAREIENEILDEFRRKSQEALVDSVRAKILEKRAAAGAVEPAGEEWVLRLSLLFRVQHMILFSSVILLIFTGLPLKFPESFLAKLVFATQESFIVAKTVHRAAAASLAFFVILHLYYVLFTRDGRADFVHLLPRPKDALDVLDNLKYFFGASDRPARFDRFSYVEKFDYWAVYWGVIIMVGTGLALWFQEQFLTFMPKYLFDVLKEMHSDEALLATLAIVIWHFYNVHLNPSRFPGTLLWWHGRISADEMKRDHPLEYERLMRKRAESGAAGAGGKGTEPS
ncbi:MAG: cytochrome b/b6 domain-containing protein [bacterium]